MLVHASVAAAEPGTEPASQSTSASRPAGRWACYLRCDNPVLVAAGREALWFQCGAGFWRYDVGSQTVRQVSPMDGVLLEGDARGALAADGRFAIANHGRPYLWTPLKGWSAVPVPTDGNNPERMAFDEKGTMWAFSVSEAWRWDGRWLQVGRTATYEALARCGGKWLFHNGGLGPRPHGTFFLAGDALDGFAPRWNEATEPLWRFLPVGDRLYGVFPKPAALAFGDGPCVLREITLRDMTDRAEGDAVGVDLAGKGFLKLTITVRFAEGYLCQVEVPDGERPAPLLLPNHGWESRPLLLRDGNGHVWVNHRRWDGKEWKEIEPPSAYPWPSADLAMAGRAELDTATMKWRRTEATTAATQGASTKRFAPISPGGLATVDPSLAGPFHGPDGQVWWCTRTYAYRLDAEGKPHEYATTLGDVPAINGSTPTLAISPRGGVWLWHCDRVWGRYDAKVDRFVRADPCEDFAFTLGSQQLSAIPPTGDARCGRLLRKRSDAWEPMPNPFGPGELGVTPRCARAGRLLVTCWQGAFEYDAAGDEWVCLHGGRDLAAWFDAAGRRVLATTDPVGQIFVYEGDPFAARPPPDAAVAAMFGQLLKQMDDASYQVRTKATQEVLALGEPSAGLIRAALRTADLPAEVRDRLESALRDLNVMEKLPRTNLFSQMHPPLTPPK